MLFLSLTPAKGSTIQSVGTLANVNSAFLSHRLRPQMEANANGGSEFPTKEE